MSKRKQIIRLLKASWELVLSEVNRFFSIIDTLAVKISEAESRYDTLNLHSAAI